MYDIFLFNPTGEMAIANGTASYMPPKNLQIFERDLSIIPSYFAMENDIVLTENIPPLDFIEQWLDLGLPKINYLPLKDLQKSKPYKFLRPWSWNPASHHKLKFLKESGSNGFKSSPNFIWDQAHKLFFSRSTTNQVQNYICQNQNRELPIDIPQPAINIYSIEELQKWVLKYPKSIIKLPWSSSGRGIHVINPDNNQPINYPWLRGGFKQQGFVTAEPLLDKIFDFSFQLYLRTNGDIDFLGISYFINDSKGHFIGGNINWPHHESEISRFLSKDILDGVVYKLIQAIKTVNPHQFYEGPIGVDAIVYTDENGKLKIHPCLDINWRYNMGVVNINLSKYLQSNSIGQWKVGSFKPGGWNLFIEEMKEKHPLYINNAMISSGFINMTPSSDEAQFGVWMEVWNKKSTGSR